ncbi:hypothetical protein BC938DRAFT_472038 [Jimgerdemannia flammicorona]|uniref:Uncharacterized protein n=1 Tax=Jimgerdemannia flammicorona TaxID=994334 RepID=A0A433Q6X3_9FUNG|nr:hypothetical protein BC938DRAFT_472038 [Jimgerdemannia flammicorona]
MPGTSHKEAHKTLAKELKTLLEHLADGSQAWIKAKALQNQLKVIRVYAPTICWLSGLILDVEEERRGVGCCSASISLRRGTLCYVGSAQAVPCAICRLTGTHLLARSGKHAMLILTVTSFSKRQNWKNVVATSIWVDHQESLLKTSAESKINEAINKNKIEDISRTATSAAAEAYYAQKHEIFKRPNADVNTDKDTDGVRPSDSFGAKVMGDNVGEEILDGLEQLSKRLRREEIPELTNVYLF